MLSSRSQLLTARLLQGRGNRDASSGHTSGVNAVSISAQGNIVATAAKDHTLRVWSTEDGRCQYVLRGEACCCLCLAGWAGVQRRHVKHVRRGHRCGSGCAA